MFERAALLSHAEGLPRGVPGDADALLARTGVLLPLSRHLRLASGPGLFPVRKSSQALHAIDAISSP